MNAGGTFVLGFTVTSPPRHARHASHSGRAYTEADNATRTESKPARADAGPYIDVAATGSDYIRNQWFIDPGMRMSFVSSGGDFRSAPLTCGRTPRRPWRGSTCKS